MHHCPPSLRRFSLTLLAGLSAGFSVAAPQAMAQIDTVANFSPPPMSSPGNREAGGVRSDTCASTTDSTGLMALVPNTNVGLSRKASPDLFAYIPPNNAQRAEFRLFKESTGEEVYAGTIQLPAAQNLSDYSYGAAIATIPLSTVPATLQPDENYLWALMLVCNEANRAEDIVIQSVVQRVGDDYLSTLPADVTKQLAQVDLASSEEMLSTYGSAGLWQDLLSELSDLAQSNPAQYDATWTSLLTNQGMGAIANAPIYNTTLRPL